MQTHVKVVAVGLHRLGCPGGARGLRADGGLRRGRRHRWRERGGRRGGVRAPDHRPHRHSSHDLPAGHLDPGLITGFGLLSWKPWARILGIVLCAIQLIHIPLGTILGIYGLWVLLNSDTERLFSNRQSGPATDLKHSFCIRDGMSNVGPSPTSAPPEPEINSHTSTQQWQSFEFRMRHRRAERCLLRAEMALDAGLDDEAREALDEAERLNSYSPKLADLRSVLDRTRRGNRCDCGSRAARGGATAVAQRGRRRGGIPDDRPGRVPAHEEHLRSGSCRAEGRRATGCGYSSSRQRPGRPRSLEPGGQCGETPTRRLPSR